MKFPARALLVSIMLISSFGLFSQSKNVSIKDEKSGKNILIGYCDRSGLEQGFFGAYFSSQNELYMPKESIIKKLTAKTLAGSAVYLRFRGGGTPQRLRLMVIW